ncbi:hypothetical protein GCM10010103_66060 [Streptomyces paradoxus]
MRTSRSVSIVCPADSRASGPRRLSHYVPGLVAVVALEPGVGQEDKLAARHLYSVSEVGRLLG